MRELTSREIAEWIAYSELEPFGSRHRDEHFGIATSVLANIHRKDGTKPLKPKDFRIKTRLDEEPKKQANDQAAINILLGLKGKKDG